MRKSFWLIPILFALPALAVIPQFWEVRTYDEFRSGELHSLSVTSDGELVLAPRFDMLFDTEEPLIFSAVTDSEGNVYLGTGHDGKVYKVDRDGNGSVLLDLGELDVLALTLDAEDVLFAATSPDGKVYRVDADGSAESFFDPEAKYIWSMVFDEGGDLLVATGDEGVIYRVGTDGQSEVFYDSDETHIITMVLDADGNVIAGGDPKGYVYRISPDGKPFVLYDSGMREVHSVAVAPDGTIYAGVLAGGSGGGLPAAPPATSETPAGTPTVSITVGAAVAAGAGQATASPQRGSTVCCAGARFRSRWTGGQCPECDPRDSARSIRNHGLAIVKRDGVFAVARGGPAPVFNRHERAHLFLRRASPDHFARGILRRADDPTVGLPRWHPGHIFQFRETVPASHGIGRFRFV